MTSFLSPSVQSVTSEAAGYPAANALDLMHPRRRWRTTATGTQHLILMLNASPPLSGVYLGACNFSSITIAASSVADFSSDVVTIVPTSVVPLIRRRTGAQGYFPTQAASNRMYLRVTPSGATEGGASFYECGQVIVVDQVVPELAQELSHPMEWTRRQGTSALEFSSHALVQVAEAGPFLEVNVGNPVWRRRRTPPYDLTTDPAEHLWSCLGTSVLLHENRADASAAYFGHLVEDPTVLYDVATFSAGLRLREYA